MNPLSDRVLIPETSTEDNTRYSAQTMTNFHIWYQINAYDMQINFVSSGMLKFEAVQNGDHFSM